MRRQSIVGVTEIKVEMQPIYNWWQALGSSRRLEHHRLHPTRTTNCTAGYYVQRGIMSTEHEPKGASEVERSQYKSIEFLSTVRLCLRLHTDQIFERQPQQNLSSSTSWTYLVQITLELLINIHLVLFHHRARSVNHRLKRERYLHKK